MNKMTDSRAVEVLEDVREQSHLLDHERNAVIHAIARLREPAGVGGEWVLVPREPTEAMHTAHAMYGDTSDWWNAVLASAPQPPAEAQDKWKSLIGTWQRRAEAAGYEGVEGAMEAAEAQARGQAVDREADRARFSDAAFNAWLDTGISDAGHTVWDAVGDVQAAWAGWEARQFAGDAVLIAECCGREECGGECGNEWRGMGMYRKPQAAPQPPAEAQAQGGGEVG